MKYSILGVCVGLLLAAPGAAQNTPNVTLTSSVSYGVGTCADLWVDGDLLFIARRSQGFDILDVSDPDNPSGLFSGRSDLFVQDVKVDGTTMYCSNESGNGQSVVVFDIADPSNPIEIGSFGGLSMFACNNMARFGSTLYCCSVTGNRVVVLDVSTPSAPIEVTSFSAQSIIALVHDVAVVGDRLYVSWLSGGFEIHDISTPQSPSLVLAHQVPTSLIHNTYPLRDGIHVATTDEVSGGYLRIWNITNPATPNQVAQWRAHPVAVMHNLQIVGDYAFITNYTQGLRIVDLRVPTLPQEAGFYDTFPMVNPFAFGAWGVYAERNNVYVADFNTGLYVFDFNQVGGILSSAQTSVTWGQTINLSVGGDSTAATLDSLIIADLSFSISQLGPATASLFTLQGPFPAGFNGTIPYDIPLPAGGPPGPYDVTFTLTIADITNNLVFDTATANVQIN
ncbi:MAG: hypothetical protein CMJ83_16180 [Planctomycetes bacterium]|nr:hypothetical protein [Planctomycetota bacterium]